MRAIATPNLDPQEVYQACVNSISDEDLRNRLNACSHGIVVAAKDYQERGVAKQFYTIPQNNCSDNDVVLGAVTKKELKDLYNIHMVGRAKPARDIYDSLLSRAPLGRCPFCGVGHATTLDHYLPKTKYPQLSVVPLNLVPACKDCNKRKSTAVALKAEEQTLHPYFDHQNFIDEQWLFAKVELTEPKAISYFVKTPKYWDSISKKRIHAHFDSFELAKKYTIEAANELANRELLFDDYKKEHGADALVTLLRKEAASHFSKHVNSWQTALYQAYADFLNSADKYDSVLCPVCVGERLFVNYVCPCCNGNGVVSKASSDEIVISDYQYLPCPNCKGSLGCATCGGKGKISRDKALELTKSRP